MKHITQESIDKAISVIDNLDDAHLEKVFEKYALEQQNLLAYLMSAPAEYENEQLEGLLVYYFCLINECFSQQASKQPHFEGKSSSVLLPFSSVFWRQRC